MSLFCLDGKPAQIALLPPLRRGEVEPERDRCQICRKLAWQHWTVRP
jgi:hypothetical protein